jgi:hypothetical protein
MKTIEVRRPLQILWIFGIPKETIKKITGSILARNIFMLKIKKGNGKVVKLPHFL